MLTKKDLAAIKCLVGASVNASVGTIVESSVTKATNAIISTLRAEMKQNTDDLVELITTGFNISSDHETRITRIEKKLFHNTI